MKAKFRIDYTRKHTDVFIDDKKIGSFKFKDEWDLEDKIRERLIEIKEKYATIKPAKIIEREYEI